MLAGILIDPHPPWRCFPSLPRPDLRLRSSLLALLKIDGIEGLHKSSHKLVQADADDAPRRFSSWIIGCKPAIETTSTFVALTPNPSHLEQNLGGFKFNEILDHRNHPHWRMIRWFDATHIHVDEYFGIS